MSSPSPLLSLPPHVVVNILSCLGADHRTLLRCARVCPQLRGLLFSSESLAYVWSRMEFAPQSQSAEVNEEKAQSFLTFLPLIAEHVIHLTFQPPDAIQVTDLQSLPSFPLLESLDLCENKWLETEHLLEFAQRCDVYHLDLHGCENLLNTAFPIMAQNFTLLESVDLSWCTKLGDEDGQMSLFHDSLTHLKKYNIHYVTCVYDTTILRLLARTGAAEGLNELYLDGAGLTDSSFIAIGACENLTFLGCSFCEELTDISLLSLRNMPGLNHLHMKKGPKFTSDGWTDLFRLAPFRLQFVSLMEMPGLGDRPLEHIILRNPDLKVLALDWCWEITDTGLTHLKTLLRLRFLSCVGLHNVTGDFLDFNPRRLADFRLANFEMGGLMEDMVEDIRERFTNLIVADYDGYVTNHTPLSQLRSTIEKIEGACCLRL